MKVTIKLTIDFEVRGKHRFLSFRRKNYAKATFEGVMDLNIQKGETLSLCIYNDQPTNFVIRDIQRIPDPNIPGKTENLIELYERMHSITGANNRGWADASLEYTVKRLNIEIAERLKMYYGLEIIERSCLVGMSPSFTRLPSRFGSTEYLNVELCSRH